MAGMVSAVASDARRGRRLWWLSDEIDQQQKHAGMSDSGVVLIS